MHGKYRPRRLWKLAAMAFLVAGCSHFVSEGGEDGRAVAAQFLDELRAGRLDVAWQGSSAEFKSLMGLESLRDYVKTHPVLKVPVEYAESHTMNRDGRALAEHVFRGTTKSRGKPVPATIKVLLAAGDSVWKVEHLAVE